MIEVEEEEEERSESKTKRFKSKRWSKNEVAYVYNKRLIELLSRLPKYVGRSILVHSLIHAYRLNEHFSYLTMQAASDEELKSFHSSEYIDFIKKASENFIDADNCDNDDDEEEFNELKAEFGLEYDCPLVANLYETISLIAGSSLTAAKAIASKKFKVAINWFGGWHHACKDMAAGYCYVNDICLAILHLLNTGYRNILYIDLDLHHGDGVEDAFACVARVTTLSFHKYEYGFFPGTGSAQAKGINVINVPLKEGIKDENFVRIFTQTIDRIKLKYKPDVIICQCGADTLTEDPMDSFCLTLKGIGGCVEYLFNAFNFVPFIFLGGGGYHMANTSRLWTYLTSLILNVDLDNDIPDHENMIHYKPPFELHIQPGCRKDLNDDTYVDTMLSNVFKKIDLLIQK